ncbi:MAG: cytochrome C biogenesis protein [Opitutus sp.]|nr:cytochrome C biogenesis protein [Opitutus sp.]
MLAELTDRTWLWTAAGLYLAGFVQGTASLLKNGRPAGGATYVLIATGYLMQLVGLSIRGKAVAGCPLGNSFEIFQFIAWSAITLYLVVGVTFRKSLLGYFTSCLAAALTLLSLAIPTWDAMQRSHVFGSNPWIELHAALAVFSYGVFGLLALTAIMFLLRNYSLKTKKLGGWFSFLPSIMDLDHIGVRLLGAGVTILTAALAVIALFYLRDLSSANGWKILVTTLVWIAYATVFVLRLRGRVLANRFAWAGLLLFVAAMLTIPMVDQSRRPAPKKPGAKTTSAVRFERTVVAWIHIGDATPSWRFRLSKPDGDRRGAGLPVHSA